VVGSSDLPGEQRQRLESSLPLNRRSVYVAGGAENALEEKVNRRLNPLLQENGPGE